MYAKFLATGPEPVALPGWILLSTPSPNNNQDKKRRKGQKRSLGELVNKKKSESYVWMNDTFETEQQWVCTN